VALVLLYHTISELEIRVKIGWSFIGSGRLFRHVARRVQGV